MQESLTGPDLCFMFNYFKHCKLSSLLWHGLSGRENVDGVFFKVPPKGEKLDPYEATKTTGT